MKLFVVLIVACIASYSDACSCIPRSDQVKYCDSQYAAVVYANNNGNGLVPTTTYGITEIYQFRGSPSNPTQLQTSYSSASCGVSLVAGRIYIIGTAAAAPSVSLGLCQLFEDVTDQTIGAVFQKIQTFQTTGCRIAVDPIKLPIEAVLAE